LTTLNPVVDKEWELPPPLAEATPYCYYQAPALLHPQRTQLPSGGTALRDFVVVQGPSPSVAPINFFGALRVAAARTYGAIAAVFRKPEENPGPFSEWADLERPPSATVRHLAEQVLRQLADTSLKPDRIVPSEDGEISFYFFVERDSRNSPIRFASITSTEEGELVLLRVDKARGTTDAIGFTAEGESMRQALDTLAEFIGPCPVL
jgi:hypothetical protein